MSAITEISLAHAPVLAVMHGAVFPDEPWDEAALRMLLSQPGVRGFVHGQGGFLLLRTVLDEAEILTIGALERRRGIASALLREALRRVGETGVRTIFLEVATRNEAARKLYEAFGFTTVGLRKAYYENGDDALVMRLACEALNMKPS